MGRPAWVRIQSCMSCSSSASERINSYALVAYIPDPLGRYLDDLRQELVPSCRAQAHVTVLPPRPLAGDPNEAFEQIVQDLQPFPSFSIEINGVEVFTETSVVYLAIGSGFSTLQRMHAALNAGRLAFQEPYGYFPHVTVAQEMLPEEFEQALERARSQWAAAPVQHSFEVHTLTFVQAAIVPETGECRWINLAECSLGRLAPVHELK